MKLLAKAGFALAAVFALTANAQDLTGTLKKVKDTGAITVGHRESSIPFSYLDDKQQPIGYAMDLCMKIVDAVKAELKMPNLKVNLQPVTSGNRIPQLQAGNIDLECGSTTNSVERQKQVSFGPTYFVINVTAAVKKSSGIKALADLNGKTISTTSGTTSVPLLKKYDKTANVEIKEIYGKDHAESFLLLAQDRTSAFVMDDILLAGQIANSGKPGRLHDHRRIAAAGTVQHDAAQGRPAVQGARRQDDRRRHEVGRDRQDLRQVVHEPDSAQGRQHEFPADAGDQGGVRESERQGRRVTGEGAASMR